MNKRRFMQVGWSLLLMLLLSALAVTPVSAASMRVHKVTPAQGASMVNATVYLTGATLQPMFQSNIDNSIPGAVNTAITSVVSQLPAEDRGWATQMATALLQPSATLTSFTPQQKGIGIGLKVSLYPGDPQPIGAQMLTTFSVQGNMIQVNAQPVSGPTLVNGPVTTFQLPIGQLSSVASTPNCGTADLAVNLQAPISLGQTASIASTTHGNTSVTAMQQSNAKDVGQMQKMRSAAQSDTNSYIEIPSASLASLGSSIGTLQVSSSLSAQNIQLAVQGSNLIVTSDIYLGTILIGTATTTMTPTALNGSLAVNVLSTSLTILQIFTFPENNYDQQIEQTLNAKLNNALTGQFNVTNAAIGPNSNVPCAASNSLVLTGTTNLV